MIKFGKKFIKNGEDTINVSYFFDKNKNEIVITGTSWNFNKKTLDFLLKDHATYIDNSDSMTDYFERPRIVITSKHYLFDEIAEHIEHIESLEAIRKLNKAKQLEGSLSNCETVAIGPYRVLKVIQKKEVVRLKDLTKWTVYELQKPLARKIRYTYAINSSGTRCYKLSRTSFENLIENLTTIKND